VFQPLPLSPAGVIFPQNFRHKGREKLFSSNSHTHNGADGYKLGQYYHTIFTRQGIFGVRGGMENARGVLLSPALNKIAEARTAHHYFISHFLSSAVARPFIAFHHAMFQRAKVHKLC